MSLRTAILVVASILACAAPASAQADYKRLSGVATGEGRVNAADLQLVADLDVRLSHIGPGKAHFAAQGAKPDGVVRAVGPFTIVARDGDTVTGTFTMNGVGPTLDPHPIGVLMTITGGTGRFERARGTLVTATWVTPSLPFTPPVLFQDMRAAVHGFIDY